MEYRQLGSTPLKVSSLGFGCGSIGGLLVRGEYPKMREAVARAIDLGITYFDTASMYGNGQSEVNLGAVLRELQALEQVVVGTKVRIRHAAELERLDAFVTDSVEQSLRRLGLERIDLIQFHNRIGANREMDGDQVVVEDVARVAATFEHLAAQGKVGHWGITGLGETAALHETLKRGGLHSVQSCFNLLNPSAGHPVPADFPYQDYGQLIDAAGAQGMGVVAIRVLAGGALSGVLERHPVAAPAPNPIASAENYADDVTAAQRFLWLVSEGHVENLVEGAVRFVISKPQVSTALVGVSNLEQLEAAVRYAEHGPLADDVVARCVAS
ncbi:MAG: aldo/keto reductase [Caldilineaceae bacterium]|nr:aldo/keto reductase [Caldilineaceae bacterium]